MIGVMIIPTGLGCEIGGHAGDATPAAKLVASVCDKLILHPNVVNASDVNEMPDNSLYVEGSILDRFLAGEIELQSVLSNRILVVVNSPVPNEIVNSVSAARVTIGADISIEELHTSLKLVAKFSNNGVAGGYVFGWRELVKQVSQNNFDALAVVTKIIVDKEIALNYLNDGGVNPWGGVEAKVSKLIATALNKPVAHAPLDSGVLKDFNEIVDPRMAAEVVSICYMHCVLKGLHKAPRIGKGLSVHDVDFLISPYGCFGNPHKACLKYGIPVIVVRENKVVFPVRISDKFICVDNYLEAVGVIATMKAGVSIESVRRPVRVTLVRK